MFAVPSCLQPLPGADPLPPPPGPPVPLLFAPEPPPPPALNVESPGQLLDPATPFPPAFGGAPSEPAHNAPQPPPPT